MLRKEIRRQDLKDIPETIFVLIKIPILERSGENEFSYDSSNQF